MKTVSRLRIERIKRGLTQEDVYLRTQRRIHPSRLSKIERGILEPTQLDLHLLAEALDVSVDELVRLEQKAGTVD